MKSKIIEWFERKTDMRTGEDRAMYFSNLGFLGVVISGVVFLVLKGMYPYLSGWWILTGVLPAFIPYLLGLIEVTIRGLLNFGQKVFNGIKAIGQRFLSTIKMMRDKAQRKRVERFSKEIYSGHFVPDKFEPFRTQVNEITDSLIKEVCLEVFTDQLGRSLNEDESVTVVDSEILSNTEAVVLTCLKQYQRRSNGQGANTDNYQCVNIGLRLKLYPDQDVLIPEYIMAFPGLNHKQRMRAIVDDIVNARRQAEQTYISAYDERHDVKHPVPVDETQVSTRKQEGQKVVS